MGDLERDVEQAASRLVAHLAESGQATLDYSEESLATIEALLAEASKRRASMTDTERAGMVWAFGSYILAVGRRLFGGVYLWHPGYEAPLLRVGAPEEHTALLTFRKVDGRIGGDEGNNIPFFFDGFASRVRKPIAGQSTLCI